MDAFACRIENTQSIQVISRTGIWLQGESICQQYLGDDAHFIVPTNGYQMDLLKTAAAMQSSEEIWLNYHTNDEVHWIANPNNKITT